MMPSRRDFLRHGVLLSALVGLGPAAAAVSRGSAGLWVIDRQMPGAPAAAAAAAAISDSLEVHQFAADPGRVWMHVIAPRLTAAPLAIGGYTNASVLFCLHYLARDFGMTLAGVAEGMLRPNSAGYDPQALIDLRDPRFSNHHTAFTWLMLPRSV